MFLVIVHDLVFNFVHYKFTNDHFPHMIKILKISVHKKNVGCKFTLHFYERLKLEF